jgi:hypothetical protein
VRIAMLPRPFIPRSLEDEDDKRRLDRAYMAWFWSETTQCV